MVGSIYVTNLHRSNEATDSVWRRTVSQEEVAEDTTQFSSSVLCHHLAKMCSVREEKQRCLPRHFLMGRWTGF